MKKAFWGIMISMVLIGLSVLIYFNRDSYIIDQTWKYRDGAHMGDWVIFNTGPASLKKGIIYMRGVEFARVEICLGKLLIIYSPVVKRYGSYINKT